MELHIINNNKIKVFISSVLWEDNNEWNLRFEIANKIREQNCETWLWEENGIEEQRNGKQWLEIVSDAIKNSDLVITFYKTRAGDTEWYNFNIPFYPTDYEISESIRLDIPLLLYIIGSTPNDKLKEVKSIYFNPIIIGSKPRYCHDETDLIRKVLIDIKDFNARVITNTQIFLPFEQLNIEDSFEIVHSILQGEIANSNYKEAFDLTRLYSNIVTFPTFKIAEKFYIAECFSDFANIYANRALYKNAIVYCFKSIRLFLELGEWEKAFGQIQALSGIKNMAGIKSASLINAYGFRNNGLYKNLASDFRDSKISILRDNKNYNKAFKEFSLEDIDKSPYTLAKYTNLQGLINNRKNVDSSRKMFENEILPWARNEKRDVAYVLKEAASLAILDMDFLSANKYLEEAEEQCNVDGTIHTKNKIIQLRKNIILKI